jgi:predicted amidophosphoribosyltransferase
MKMTEICQTCALVLGPPRRCPNYWCGRRDRGWELVWAVGEHRGWLRHAIARLKYRDDRRWVAPLAGLLAAYLLDHAPAFDDVDLIVGVPSKVGRSRRADHVGLLLGAVAPVVGELWPVAGPEAVLAQRAEARPLVGAPSAVARRLRAAVEVRASMVVTGRPAVRGARVLVVDDVLTDGSTLREVALALRRAGAVAVSGLVLARQPVTGAPTMPW